MIGAALALAAIGMLTLAPHTVDPEVPGFFCLACGQTGGVDFILNILLFVPLGAAMALLTERVSWIVAIALGLSLSIETTQGLLLAGRDASLGDVVSNTLGALIGGLFTRHAVQLLIPSPRLSRRLTLGYSLLVTLLLACAGWALTPHVAYQKYWAQWLPIRYGYEVPQGRLVALSLNGRPLQPAERVDPSVRPIAVGGRLEFEARTHLFAFPRGIALIARLINPLNEAANVSLMAHGVIARIGMRSAALRLRTPFVAVACAPRSDEDDATEFNPFAVTLRAALVGPRQLRAQCISGTTTTHEVTLRPALLWTLAWPREVALTAREPLVTAFWMAVLFLPLGYWRVRWTYAAELPTPPTHASAITEPSRLARFSADFSQVLGRPGSVIVPLVLLVSPTIATGATNVAITDALGAVVGGMLGGMLCRLTLKRSAPT